MEWAMTRGYFLSLIYEPARIINTELTRKEEFNP